jgi:hypothetical protein
MIRRTAVTLAIAASAVACSSGPLPVPSPSPATTVPRADDDGVSLVVQLDGEIGCNQFPYGCGARLSVLPAGTEVPAIWRPAPDDPAWAPAGMGDDTLDPTPYRPVPTLAPGGHRLVVSLLGSYDTPSYAPDGSIATDLLSRCTLDVDVASGSGPIAVRVTFTPHGESFGGTCVIEGVD